MKPNVFFVSEWEKNANQCYIYFEELELILIDLLS